MVQSPPKIQMNPSSTVVPVRVALWKLWEKSERVVKAPFCQLYEGSALFRGASDLVRPRLRAVDIAVFGCHIEVPTQDKLLRRVEGSKKPFSHPFGSELALL